MSLLLDALKKAADDKKKNLDGSAETHAEAINQDIDNTDDSLELELDLQSGVSEKDPQAENASDFPAVDETSITIPESEVIQVEKEDKPDADKSAEIIEDDLSARTTADTVETTITNSATNETDAAENSLDFTVDKATATDIDTDTDIPPDAGQDDREISTVPNANDENVSAIPAEREPDNSELNKKLAAEQALSALINKSNQYSQRERLKRTMAIALLVTLLLIGSAIFYYIKMDTATQELFIAQNNTAPVNRNLPSMPVTEPASRTPAVQAEQAATMQSVSAEKSAPLKPVSKPRPVAKPKTFSIVQTNKVDPVNQLLQDAYSSFLNNDFDRSKLLYDQVNKQEPRNRDALLGQAAVAVKQQRYEYARQKYQTLLQLNPKDSLATAGISSIENKVDPQLNISQLKFMLKEQPDAAHLYFALGSLYAANNNWPEAQSAYFSAWSADSNNADYAYNLAVSLDHINKPQQALQFYNTSLKLKTGSHGNFSDAAIQQRIHSLQGASR